LDLNKKDPNPSGWLPVSGLLSTTAIPDRKGRRQRHQADNPKEVHAKLDADRTTGGIDAPLRRLLFRAWAKAVMVMLAGKPINLVSH
jgi:hypothetical protein